MGLLRFLFFALAIGFLAVVVKRLLAPEPEKKEQPREPYNPMVRCAHCGVNLPRDHAIRSKDGHYYCSIEHRDANQR